MLLGSGPEGRAQLSAQKKCVPLLTYIGPHYVRLWRAGYTVVGCRPDCKLGHDETKQTTKKAGDWRRTLGVVGNGWSRRHGASTHYHRPSPTHVHTRAQRARVLPPPCVNKCDPPLQMRRRWGHRISWGGEGGYSYLKSTPLNGTKNEKIEVGGKRWLGVWRDLLLSFSFDSINYFCSEGGQKKRFTSTNWDTPPFQFTRPDPLLVFDLDP